MFRTRMDKISEIVFALMFLIIFPFAAISLYSLTSSKAIANAKYRTSFFFQALSVNDTIMLKEDVHGKYEITLMKVENLLAVAPVVKEISSDFIVVEDVAKFTTTYIHQTSIKSIKVLNINH